MVAVAEAPGRSRGGIEALHRVERLMGTAVSFDIRDPGVGPGAFDEVVSFLRDVEARFSTYRPDSEVSRLSRAEVREADCSADVRYVLALCDNLRRTSDGYFDIRHAGRDGGLDPSGLVKGWSIEEAAAMLERAGARNFSINAGGDVIARGEPEPGRPWRVGIRHPDRADRLAAVLAIRDVAVATSGAYERGDHISDPHTGRPARGLVSVTVVGPSLTYADAYATTAFAMGTAGLSWVAGHPGYGVYGITDDGRVQFTPDVELVLASGLRRPGRIQRRFSQPVPSFIGHDSKVAAPRC
jgi:thiamine biosynthesis lipoprotein